MWNTLLASGLAAALLAACSAGGKTNGQAVAELRPLFAPKAELLKELAQALPSTVKETSIPKTLEPPLVYYDDTRRAATPKTLDFTAVETLADPNAKPACGMYPGSLVTCIQWTGPGSPFAGIHANKPDLVTPRCRSAVDIRYLLAIKVVSCGDAKVTSDKTFSARGIDYEAFLLDLTTGAVIGTVSGRAFPPDSVTVYSSSNPSNTVDLVQGATRQAVIDDIFRNLKGIPGSQLP